jgi:hypothetical protein
MFLEIKEGKMEKVMKATELTVTAENTPGILAEVTHLIADGGVNIENICAYKTDQKAILSLLTNDNEKAKKILEGKGYQTDERQVIVLILWNRPGALSAATTKFRENGINLHSVYGTSSADGVKTNIVFCADDNDKATEIFDSMVIQEAMESI